MNAHKLIRPSIALGPLLLSALSQTMFAEQTAPDGLRALETIVVTAQKRESDLQDTPISLLAFDSSALEKYRVTGLADLDGYVPGLAVDFHQNGAATTMFKIRGVGTTDDQITLDSPVAVYVDGVYLARGQGMALSVADIARVEVLRGPQGSLYGRNATSGAINVITTPPNPQAVEFKARGSIGNFSERTASLMVNAPLGENAALRLSYLKETQDGYIKNPGENVDRWGDKNRQALRADFLWNPTTDLSLRYSYDWAEINDTPAHLAPMASRTDLGDWPKSGSPLVRFLSPYDVTPQGHALTVDWQYAENHSLKSITSYRTVQNFQNQDYLTGVTGPVLLANNRSDMDAKQVSQEIQLLGDLSTNVEYVAGLYYFNESGDYLANSFSQPSQTVDIFGNTAESTSYAAFGQIGWRPASLQKLKFTFGARYSVDEREATYSRQRRTLLPDQVYGDLRPSLDIGTIIYDYIGQGKDDYSAFTPSIIAEYDLAEGSSLYAKAVKGYKTGGFNTRASSPQSFENGFDAETLWSYEAGLKSQFFNNRARTNISVFLSDYKDIQLNVPSETNIRLSDTINAGKATLKGVEFDATLIPLSGLQLSLNYAYLDASYDEVLNLVCLPKSGPVFELVPAPIMELRHGQESQA